MEFSFLVLEDMGLRIDAFKKRFKELEQDSGVKIHVDFVNQAQQAIDLLQFRTYDAVFLDHDLGGEVMVSTDRANTGSEVARFLNKHPESMPQTIFIHSFNPGGAKYMHSLLPGSQLTPGIWEYFRFHNTIKLD